MLEHPRLVRIVAYVQNTNGECFDGGHPTNPFLIMEYVARPHS